MTIPEDVRKEIYKRAGGRCECVMSLCKHHAAGERCAHKLGLGWEAHHKWANGPSVPSNLIAMCRTCHKNTRTYGK